jgi:hypothetical protein
MTSYVAYTLWGKRYDKGPIYCTGKKHEWRVDYLYPRHYKFKPSTVGIPNQGNIIDKKNRTSFTCINKFKIQFSNEPNYDKIHTELIKLLPEKYKSYPIKFEFPDCTLLKYIKGSFFKTHMDGKKSENHIAVGLLYPPSNYIGGKLYVYEDDNKIQIKKDSTHWQFVAIKLGTPHEVTEITHGKRYAFKFNIMMEAIKEINFISNKIYYKQIKLNKHQHTWTELLQEVKIKFAEHTSVNVVLTSYYRYPMPQLLNEEDTNLYNVILSNIPNSIISFDNIKTKETDDCGIEGKLDDEYVLNEDVPLPDNIVDINDGSYVYQFDKHLEYQHLYQCIDYASIQDQTYSHYINQYTIMKITTGITDKLISGIVTILPSVLIDIIMEYVH